jgi:hypothetical protein
MSISCDYPFKATINKILIHGFHPSGPASIDDDELQLALAMSRSGGTTGAMPSHQPQAQVSTSH